MYAQERYSVNNIPLGFKKKPTVTDRWKLDVGIHPGMRKAPGLAIRLWDGIAG